jgi:hypothetical protein
MFNLVKLGYHKKKTYTYSQLLDCINEHDQIDVTKMEEKDMFNFLEWQDNKHYKQPTAYVMIIGWVRVRVSIC